MMYHYVVLSCFLGTLLLATGFQNHQRLQAIHFGSKAERHAVHWTLKAEADTDHDPTENTLPTPIVSDAEALLACWSYLKRRRRIGNWTNFERRKAIKQSLKPSFFSEEEDYSELLMDNDEEYEEDENEYDVVRSLKTDGIDGNEVEGERNENHDDLNPEKWFGEFTSFPTEATATRTRRSRAAKRTWKDSEFRKRWKESRWGGKRSKDEEHQRLVESRVRNLPREFWGSTELASMTKEEINSAIETYARGRKKRSESIKRTIIERKKAFEFSPLDNEDERVARNALFALDHETLKEQQRSRSERAKAIYQARLENEKRRNPKPKSKPKPKEPAPNRIYLPHGATPQDAILRIEDQLARNEYPSVEDVQIIMRPQKLGKRRDLLKGILLEFFDLRGKCVPYDFEDENSETEFIRKVAIQHLGAFVIWLLKKEHGERKTEM